MFDRGGFAFAQLWREGEILVFRGFDREGAEKILPYNMTPVVSTWEHVERLEAAASTPVGIHFKI